MIRRGDFSKGFHTFGIQWTPKYIYFYIDSRIHQIMFMAFQQNRPLYDFGGFANMAENQTLLANPWAMSNSTSGNAPFDQRFYLILNVAVGSKNGWFLCVFVLLSHFVVLHCTYKSQGTTLATSHGLTMPKMRNGLSGMLPTNGCPPGVKVPSVE
jgi:beta-glucanase (GH16 family)